MIKGTLEHISLDDYRDQKDNIKRESISNAIRSVAERSDQIRQVLSNRFKRAVDEGSSSTYVPFQTDPLFFPEIDEYNAGTLAGIQSIGKIKTVSPKDCNDNPELAKLREDMGSDEIMVCVTQGQNGIQLEFSHAVEDYNGAPVLFSKAIEQEKQKGPAGP